MKNRYQRFLEFWRIGNRYYFYILILIVLAGAFLRLVHLNSNLEFLGDQGRDALIVSRIFRQRDFVFIGPVTSVGNMYLGPFYYYLMLPFLYITYPSPIGPAYMVALLGIATIVLTFFLGRQMFGERAALLAGFFLAFDQAAIRYSRFSWNPNPAPFFSLILVWAVWRAWQKDKRYWLLASLMFAILIQLHYLTLLSAGGAGLVWLWQWRELWRHKQRKELKKMWLYSALGALLLALSFTPLILFDYRHNWLNWRALQNMVVGEDNFALSGWQKVIKAVRETHGRSLHIFFEHSLGQHRKTNTFLLLALISGLLASWRSAKMRRYRSGLAVLLSFIITGIIGTAFYRHTVFDHYVLYLFPIAFLLYGLVWEYFLLKFGKPARLALLVFVLLFLRQNYSSWPLKEGGYYQHIQKVSDFILQHLDKNSQYNIVLLSGSGDIDGQNYRYFLQTSQHPPVDKANRGAIDTLVVINEDRKITRVQDSPIYEIVVFPYKDQPKTYTINGTEIIFFEKPQ